jgi:hypothetical protein
MSLRLACAVLHTGKPAARTTEGWFFVGEDCRRGFSFLPSIRKRLHPVVAGF